MSLLPPTFERDVLRALQLSYYVDSISIIGDYDFDEMELAYKEETGQALPVGSDNLNDYSPAERALALYLQFGFGKKRA